MEEKEHIKTIEQVEKYLNKKDYGNLKKYLSKRKVEISNKKNKIANEYINQLIEELK